MPEFSRSSKPESQNTSTQQKNQPPNYSEVDSLLYRIEYLLAAIFWLLS